MAKAKSKKITLEKALVPLEEQPYEVPENWCWIKLGVISSIISKGTTPKGGKSAYVDEGIDFLRVENINDDGTICHDDMMHVTEETHTGFLKRSILEENDILVSIAGTLGKTAIVKNDDLPLNTNQAVAFVRLKDNGEVSREYIRYAIDTPVIQNMLLSKTKVTAIPNLTLEIISECLIPFPPLAEQQRIVEQIESLFAKLDMAREKAEFVISCFEERMVAIIHKAFEGVLTRKWREANNVSCDSWKMVPLKNCGRWFGGGTPATSVGAYWEKDDIPWITSKDMKDRVIEDSIMHITMAGVENSSANYCDEPAVLFVMRSGILRRVFPVCMVNRPFTVNQDLKACVPAMNQDYLYWFCNGYEKDIRDKCMKSGTTVESVEAKKLMDYEVPVASANEQTEVVKQIESLINKEESVKELAKNVIEKIDAMKKLILAKAFRGELGTNASSEENSIELLKKMIEEGYD